MNFFKALFGNAETTPEEEKREAEEKRFDLMKYDGVKAMKIGRFDYAERCFAEALALHEDLEVRDYLSRALIQQGKYGEALEQLELLAEHQPENAAILLQASHVSYLKEDYPLMQHYAERALAVEEGSATASYLLAQAAIGQGDPIKGVAHLTQCVAQDDNHADARLLRAQTLLAMGDVNGACDDALWLTEHVGDHEDVLLLAARVAKAQGNHEKALTIYNKVTEVNPFQIDAYRERGQLLFDLGDKQRAQEDLQKVLELNPNEMADISGEYSAEGIEQKVRQAYSAANPFGL